MKKKKSQIKVRITELTAGEETVVLGTALGPPGKNQEQVEDIIDRAWSKFFGTEPNADSEFISYLMKHYGFTAWDDDAVDMIVHG